MAKCGTRKRWQHGGVLRQTPSNPREFRLISVALLYHLPREVRNKGLQCLQHSLKAPVCCCSEYWIKLDEDSLMILRSQMPKACELKRCPSCNDETDEMKQI